MAFTDFFKDKHGNQTMFQAPNMLVYAWTALLIITALLHFEYTALTVVALMVLFAWGIDELRHGVSPFRRTLGALTCAVAVLLTILVVI